MSDLVERLRRHAMMIDQIGCTSGIGRKVVETNMLEAADEIERLREAIEACLDAVDDTRLVNRLADIERIAIAALRAKQGEAREL